MLFLLILNNFSTFRIKEIAKITLSIIDTIEEFDDFIKKGKELHKKEGGI